MRIDRLTLRSFRNYRDTTVTFPAAGAYITGANGSGKTNLLEAIYFLANQTSFRTTNREELQGWGASQCIVDALVTAPELQRQSELAIALSPRGRRLMEQRNALLRGATDSHVTLGVWTERFIEVALHITKARQEHITVLNNILA